MYDDYMQNFMGFPMRQYQNTYDERNINLYGNFYEPIYQRQEWRNTMSVNDLEDCYPEIYKIVYPMVRKACMSNTMPITQTVIDNMVNEITSNLEANGTIELNITLNNEVNQNRDTLDENKKEVENRSADSEDRQIRRNSFVSDLIRILILRELIGRFGNRPGNRPPFSGNRPPMRPQMPRYDGIGDENYYYNPGADNSFYGKL